MANIKTHLNNIKGALYGKDVRNSIHDAIEQCYTDASINGNANMEVTQARGEYETLGKKLDDHASQLAQNTKNINDTMVKTRNIQLNKGFVAHRGLQNKAPENTLKAIEQAGLNGFVMCELDPRITSDGIWVLMHNATIDATTNGTGVVSNMTFEELRQYKIDTPGALIDEDETILIPTLEEAVKLSNYYGIGINIDGAKFTWDYDKAYYVYNLLKQYNMLEKSCISLTNANCRKVFIDNFPNFTICIATTSSNLDNILNTYKDNNIIIALASIDATDEAIKKCNNLGIPVYIWNANTIQDAYLWLSKGINFVETDYILPGGKF